MKRILALGMSTILALPLMSTAIVLAEGTSSGSSSTTTGTTKAQVTTTPTATSDTKTTVATTETTPTAGTDDPKALQTRLDQRKAELKVKLSSVEKLSVQSKCKAAQGLVSSVKNRVKGIETSRSEVYGNMVSRLTELSAKLKNKNADTTALDADTAALQVKITTFNTDLATYKQDVSDLADMDCKTDPDGFKASLLAARTALDSVNKDSQAIKAYVNDTIKPELKKIRDALDKSSTGGSQ